MKTPVLVLLAVAASASCAPLSHIRQLRESQVTAQLSLADDTPPPELSALSRAENDTLVVEDADGSRMILMRAVKDENGEMVAHEVLGAARVTARFRNVAERGGKVDLRFQIHVPSRMQDGRWQVRLYPDLFVLEDSLRLDPVLITGTAYRKAQLKGYQQYRRFLDSIRADSLHFVDTRQMESFLRRNYPKVYRFRTDSSYVSEEEFSSAFGVTREQALEHFTNRFLVRRNLRKIERKEQMKRRYIKSPIVTEGLRMDTVIVLPTGDFTYEYVQSLRVTSGIKKASVVLSGGVYDQDREVYHIPPVEPLTFYISSISGLTDPSVRYKTIVRERKVQANTACYIEFAQGRDEVDDCLGNNESEIARIKSNLESILRRQEFDIDSIVVSASCSPEGAWLANRRLSQRRSKAVSSYFGSYISSWTDSVLFVPRSDGENWRMLSALVSGDGNIGPEDKEQYLRIAAIPDPDSRELALHSLKSYRYLREELYPRLRVVKFGFYLTRRGVQKDTVHTTVIDTVYMEGVDAIRNRNYEKAVALLRPYRDYNAAVAYAAMDYNASAMDILASLEETDRVLYLKALIYSRKSQDAKAVECYLKACRLNPAMVHRGNLDPEISSLIKKYDIKNEDN